jgi:hypothetical protein
MQDGWSLVESKKSRNRGAGTSGNVSPGTGRVRPSLLLLCFCLYACHVIVGVSEQSLVSLLGFIALALSSHCP